MDPLAHLMSTCIIFKGPLQPCSLANSAVLGGTVIALLTKLTIREKKEHLNRFDVKSFISQAYNISPVYNNLSTSKRKW